MLALFSCSSPDAELTVEATSADLPKGDTLFLAGNLPVLGAWRPDGLAMVREGDVWRASFRVPKGERVEYKFTRGSWAKEATTEEGHVPTNHVIERVASDTLAKHDIANWKDQFFRPFGGVTGKVEHLANITPKGLTARNVWVWLPPDYEKNPNERYPVLYAHDAQNIFDPSTSTLGRDWQMDETADSLIRAGLVAPLIIVGVDCYPPKRTDEYSETELGNLYQDFMCCQLKPMIDSLYRTKADAKHTAVIGASMGGLVSFILAWERPDVFGHAGCMSPAFQIRDIDYVKYVKPDKQPKRDIDLYIDNGTVGLEAQLQPGCDAMMAALKDKGYPFVWVKDEGAEHNEIAWSKRFHRPLLQFFGR
jgi:predicted alpha/beta superfamily hydrolase